MKTTTASEETPFDASTAQQTQPVRLADGHQGPEACPAEVCPKAKEGAQQPKGDPAVSTRAQKRVPCELQGALLASFSNSSGGEEARSSDDGTCTHACCRQAQSEFIQLLRQWCEEDAGCKPLVGWPLSGEETRYTIIGGGGDKE